MQSLNIDSCPRKLYTSLTSDYVASPFSPAPGTLSSLLVTPCYSYTLDLWRITYIAMNISRRVWKYWTGCGCGSFINVRVVKLWNDFLTQSHTQMHPYGKNELKCFSLSFNSQDLEQRANLLDAPKDYNSVPAIFLWFQSFESLSHKSNSFETILHYFYI